MVSNNASRRADKTGLLIAFIIGVSFIIIFNGVENAFANELISVSPDNTMFQTSTVLPNPINHEYFTLEEFERRGQSHWYAFVGFEGQEILIKTRVPNIPNSATFTPCFDLLIGEDKITPEVKRVEVFNDFYGVEWIETCELNITLPDDGLYYIRAHDELHHYEVGDRGKFSLVIGEGDDLSFFERLLVPYWSMHVHLFFENLVFVWISLSLVLVLAITILYLFKKRNNNS